ncbi:hydrogenase maturation protease [Pseudacidobacterium ailaaui]|jgi:hydrogenase maturation protease|uniref:hydrogenase maturation protease n=1 Tax=Pseudacidobacterium ailaaui TaxID=1382359 RepID=UPI000678A6E6|nr:hydrogenase maturation protease [Pseudacidobacterium ailaaui]
MSGAETIKIRVLGLGNLMRTDDAVGMLTLRKLAEHVRFPSGIETIEGGTLGLDLVHALYGVSHLLVLDAVDTGAVPGTLTRFAGQELMHLPTSKSVHLLGLSDLINVLRLMDAPSMEVVLLGSQPESSDWGTALTPAVEASQKGLIEAALRQIEEWVRDPTGLSFHPFPDLVVRQRRYGACVSQSPEK